MVGDLVRASLGETCWKRHYVQTVTVVHCILAFDSLLMYSALYRFSQGLYHSNVYWFAIFLHSSDTISIQLRIFQQVPGMFPTRKLQSIKNTENSEYGVTVNPGLHDNMRLHSFPDNAGT